MVKDDGVGASAGCSVRRLTVKTPALLHAQGAHPVELLPRCRRARPSVPGARPHREGNAGAFATEDAHTGRETPWDEEPMRHSECSDHLNSAGSAHLVNFDDLCGVLQEMPAVDAEDSPNFECYSAGVCALFRGTMWWSAPMGRGGPFSPGRRGCSGAGSAPWSSSSAAPGGVGSAVPPRPASRRGGRRARFWRPGRIVPSPAPHRPHKNRGIMRKPLSASGAPARTILPKRQNRARELADAPPAAEDTPPGGTRRRAQKTGARTRTPTPDNHSKLPPE